MAYYNTCIYCGANLDPGEKCNCSNKTVEKPFTEKELKDYNKKNEKYFSWIFTGVIRFVGVVYV